MQFELAANTLVGDSFSKETEAELATGQQEAPPREAKDHKQKRVEGNQGTRDPEEDRKRHRKFNKTGRDSDTGCESQQASAKLDAW